MPGAQLATPFLIAFLVTLAATLACEGVARRAGLVTQPREDRWHRRPVPLLGGVAIMVGVTVASVLFGNVARLGPFLVIALLMGSVGLFDDVWLLRPHAKLVAQIVLAACLMQLEFMLRLTPYPVLNVFLTLFWVVNLGTRNALSAAPRGLPSGSGGDPPPHHRRR